MYARYDYKTIDKEDPLLVNLRDIKHYLSPMGEMMSDFYDNIVCKEDRGAIYTPVAIMWDQYHGHFSNYHGTPWGLFDNTEGDLMMHALMNSLFPEDKEKICYSRGFRTSAHGDVFDVITNASSQETLNSYPAIFFCGDVPIDDAFAAKLVTYVKGGKLVINYKQVESVVISSQLLWRKSRRNAASPGSQPFLRQDSRGAHSLPIPLPRPPRDGSAGFYRR